MWALRCLSLKRHPGSVYNIFIAYLAPLENFLLISCYICHLLAFLLRCLDNSLTLGTEERIYLVSLTLPKLVSQHSGSFVEAVITNVIPTRRYTLDCCLFTEASSFIYPKLISMILLKRHWSFVSSLVERF